MKLLYAQEIKEEKNKVIETLMEKVRKLTREELRLIESVNTKREEVAKTKILFNKELSEYQILCDERKGELQSEIKSLESKRVKLMKPIDDIQNEAYKKLNNTKYDSCDDESVYEVMRYLDLVEDLKNV